MYDVCGCPEVHGRSRNVNNVAETSCGWDDGMHGTVKLYTAILCILLVIVL